MKKIRLIELFAGVGSQACALKRLGVDFEHYRVIEFDKYPIASYNAIHGTDFKPTSITDIKGEDLGIVDTEYFTYLLTYSFPCQDLSVAGKQRGMTKGSGTRSGLLWEVERLLTETEELPQVLLMENVPQVHGKKNLDDFNKWIDFLESKGYKNFWKDLNAKDYGVAQNRNRTFMISFLDDVNYNFPEPIPLDKTMKDYLEDEVDEKFYINNDKANKLILKLVENGEIEKSPCDLSINNPELIDKANCIKARYDAGISNFRKDGSGVIETVRLTNIYGENFGTGYAGNVYDSNYLSPTLTNMQGGGRQPMIVNYPFKLSKEELETIKKNNKNFVGFGNRSAYRIRKLTPKECWRLMGFTDEEFEKAAAVNSNTQLYKQAGNSIVVDVLVAIFSEMINSLEDKTPKYQHMEQMSLFDYE